MVEAVGVGEPDHAAIPLAQGSRKGESHQQMRIDRKGLDRVEVCV